jgi:hypothetical protein
MALLLSWLYSFVRSFVRLFVRHHAVRSSIYFSCFRSIHIIGRSARQSLFLFFLFPPSVFFSSSWPLRNERGDHPVLVHIYIVARRRFSSRLAFYEIFVGPTVGCSLARSPARLFVCVRFLLAQQARDRRACYRRCRRHNRRLGPWSLSNREKGSPSVVADSSLIVVVEGGATRSVGLQWYCKTTTIRSCLRIDAKAICACWASNPTSLWSAYYWSNEVSRFEVVWTSVFFLRPSSSTRADGTKRVEEALSFFSVAPQTSFHE